MTPKERMKELLPELRSQAVAEINPEYVTVRDGAKVAELFELQGLRPKFEYDMTQEELDRKASRAFVCQGLPLPTRSYGTYVAFSFPQEANPSLYIMQES